MEKAMASHSSTLAWKMPWTEEPGRLRFMGSKESDMTEWFSFHFSLSCIGEGNGNPLQCSWLEIPGTEETSGLPSMGSHRVRHDWSDLAAAAAAAFHCIYVPPCLYPFIFWSLMISDVDNISFLYCLLISCIIGVFFLTLITLFLRRRQWHPTPVLCLENSMDGGAW